MTSAKICLRTSGVNSALLVGTRSRLTSYLPITSITTRAAFSSASVANVGAAGGVGAAPVPTGAGAMAGATDRPKRVMAPEPTCTLTFLSSALGASRITCFSRMGESARLASSTIS